MLLLYAMQCLLHLPPPLDALFPVLPGFGAPGRWCGLEKINKYGGKICHSPILSFPYMTQTTPSATAPSASRMTHILLVALSVAGWRAKQPTGAPNASHHGGKNSNCRRYVQNEGDISRWCGRITARDQPGTPDILVIFPLVSIHNSP